MLDREISCARLRDLVVSAALPHRFRGRRPLHRRVRFGRRARHRYLFS